MGTRTPLAQEALTEALRELEGWHLVGGKLHRELVFRSFTEAFAFMTAGALIAERMNHHPEWANVYNRLVMDLATHDAQGVTALDVDFARRLQPLIHAFGVSAP